MNDAQTWTAIGGMLALLFALMTLMMRLFGQVLDARIEGVVTRIDGLTVVVAHGFEQVDRRFEQVDKRFEQVDKRFEQMDNRLDRMEGRIDNLDADVRAITRRLMDGPDAA